MHIFLLRDQIQSAHTHTHLLYTLISRLSLSFSFCDCYQYLDLRFVVHRTQNVWKNFEFK